MGCMDEPNYSMEHFSIQELEEELKRRKLQKPILNPNNINFVKVIQLAAQTVEAVDQDKGLPKDFEQSMTEAVMEALYGKTIWTWWNSKLSK